MDEPKQIKLATGPINFWRGDYIELYVDGRRDTRRILAVNGNMLTTRNLSMRGIEWLRSRFEDYVKWPLAGFKSRFRVRA
jgi:hypothetical protein